MTWRKRTIMEMAKEAGVSIRSNWAEQELEAFAKLVREDERARMCEQIKECLHEKSTSNEANRSAVLGEGGQAN
jgi:uncharacterized membrane protein